MRLDPRDGRSDGPLVSTGYPSLDRALGGGLRRDGVTVLGSWSSEGKSALALNIAVRIARRLFDGDCAVHVFSGELPATQIAERIVAMEARVDMSRFNARRPTAFEMKQLEESMEGKEWLPISLHCGVLVLGDLVLRLSEGADRCALAVIDAIQLVNGAESQGEDRRLGEIIGTLKRLAMAKQVPMLLISQLRSESDAAPAYLDSLSLPPSVRAQADACIVLDRDVRPSTVDCRPMRAHVVKADGRPGMARLDFYPAHHLFEEA